MRIERLFLIVSGSSDVPFCNSTIFLSFGEKSNNKHAVMHETCSYA